MTTYLQLAALFGMLSVLSIGGGNVVLPEMHSRAVHGEHWLTSSQFADLFSISQSAPGPSILLVTLVGYGAGLHLGGVQWALLGALVATVSMILPAMLLTYLVTLFWQRAEDSRWRHAVEKGFPPMTVGLIIAAALVMSRAADHDWRDYLATAVCTVIFLRTSLNPLYLVGAAGLLGYFGII